MKKRLLFMLTRIGEKDNIGEDRTLFQRQWAEEI